MENIVELIGLTIFVLALPLAVKYTFLYGKSVLFNNSLRTRK